MPLPTDLSIPHADQVAIDVDGRGEEEAWAHALALPDFVAWAPEPGRAPAVRTELRLLSDDQHLYALFIAHDPQPRRIRVGLGRRDTRGADDRVGLYIDPSARGERSYVFAANALGVQRDAIRTNTTDSDDHAWDTHWQSAGRRTEEGYVVEMAIPWAAMRHPAHAGQIGLLAYRVFPRGGEFQGWPLTDPNAPGWITQEALLGGPGDLPPTETVALTPELTYGRDQDGPADDRLGWGGLSPGLTARWSPTAAVQVLGTLNPDFSQVESDATQIGVNRRYALYYPEKRPFFLEGQEWFAHPAGRLVYTRSMVAPRYGARSTVEAGPWKVAALHVMDAHPGGTVSEGGGWTEDQVGDALAWETVGRIQRQLERGGHLGLLFSDRQLPRAGLSNEVFGLDTQAQLGDADSVEAAATFSHTTAVDSGAAPSPNAYASWSHSGRHLTLTTATHYISPTFRAENGFVPLADSMGGDLDLKLFTYPDLRGVRKLSVNPITSAAAWRTDTKLRSWSWAPATTLTFSNGGQVWGEWLLAGETFADTPLSWSQPSLGARTSITRFVNLIVEGYTGTGPVYDPTAPAVGEIVGGTGTLTVQAGAHVTLSGSASAERLALDGAALYEGVILRTRIDAYATPEWWARLILQRSTFDEAESAELLLAWEEGPASAIWLGGNVADNGVDEALQWAVLTKASWTFGAHL